MSLQILSIAWGKRHIELFQQTALRSLSWPKNRAAIQAVNATWNIFTDDTNMARMKDICHIPGIEFNIQSTTKLRKYIDQVQSANIWAMELCIERKEKLLLAPPDTIFGDGTILGLLTAGFDQDSVVVVPHPRVLPTILDNGDMAVSYNFTNSELVDLAWDYLHDSWVHAERGHSNQSSYVGGVEWWRSGDNICGTHRLPSPYLCSFTQEDLMYFKSAISFGHFDHKWPGDILIPRCRQRYLASSNAAFIMEITEADKNVPPIIENQPSHGFWRNDIHNQANGQIIFTFTGAE